MASTKFNAKSPTIRRILKEAQELENQPSPDYTAGPLESDLYEWHFTFRGPPNSVYSTGIYHGRIILPHGYPLRPPSFRFVTPSGRFEVNREICLSISGHHEETWQPAWGVRTALVALRSFMETDPKGQLGGLDTTNVVRKRMASESRAFKCQVCGKTNNEIMKECEDRAGVEDRNADDTPDRQNVWVPPELKMAWKDELLQVGDGSHNADRATNAEAAQLADCFVQTAPTNSPVNRTVDSGSSVPVRASTARLQKQEREQQGEQRSRPHPPAARSINTVHGQAVNGVPSWLDHLIVALFVVLVALIINRVLALGR